MIPSSSSSETAGVAATLKDDLERIKRDVGKLASDAVNLPRNAIFGDFETSVRRQPLQSLAIAVGVGVVIGLILRR